MNTEEKLGLMSEFGDVQIARLSNGKHRVTLVPFDTRLEVCGELAAVCFGVDKAIHVCWLLLANVLATMSIQQAQIRARWEERSCQRN